MGIALCAHAILNEWSICSMCGMTIFSAKIEPCGAGLGCRSRRPEAQEDQTTVRPIFRVARSASGTALQARSKAFAPADVAQHHPNSFFVQMDGQEMSRIYPEGCCLLVDPTATPWNGCCVVALVDGRNIVIRRYICGNDTVILSSHSFQTASPDLMLNRRRVRVIGVVVWFQASHSIKVQQTL